MVRIRRTAQQFVRQYRTIPQSRFACQLPLHKGALEGVQLFPIAGNIPRIAQSSYQPVGERKAPLAPLCNGSCRPQAAEGLCGMQKRRPAIPGEFAEASPKLCEFVRSFRGNGTNSPYFSAVREMVLHNPSVTLRVPAPFTQGSFWWLSNPFPLRGGIPRIGQGVDETVGERDASLAPLCKGSCRPQAAEGLCRTQKRRPAIPGEFVKSFRKVSRIRRTFQHIAKSYLTIPQSR